MATLPAALNKQRLYYKRWNPEIQKFMGHKRKFWGKHFEYQDSWNLLMEVVGKIEKTAVNVDGKLLLPSIQINSQEVKIYTVSGVLTERKITEPTNFLKSKALYDVIVEFLIKYNDCPDIPAPKYKNDISPLEKGIQQIDQMIDLNLEKMHENPHLDGFRNNCLIRIESYKRAKQVMNDLKSYELRYMETFFLEHLKIVSEQKSK